MSTRKTKPIGLSSILSRDEMNDKHPGTHTVPIYQSSTFIYESAEKAQQVFRGQEEAYIYSRWSHPNAELVEKKMEQLECYGLGVKAKALVFSSGMAAISALFQSVLKRGDAVIAQGNIYGTTVDYLNHYSKEWGVEVLYADLKNLKDVEALLRQKQNVRLVYIETPSNPTLQCYDLSKLSALAKTYRAFTAVDNTFATPYLQQPFKWGVDFIVHSGTKYLNGHGTGLSGFLVGRNPTFIKKEVWKIRKLNGTIATAFECWLLNNGLKTLPLRMEQHSKNALLIARALVKHPAIAKVHYPGLKDHDDFKLAKKQMRLSGGVLSFELKGGSKTAQKLMNKIRFCKLTASLGTTDTLLQHPASMSHYFVPQRQREQFGITDGLIRLSVGIENAEDILEDILQAIK